MARCLPTAIPFLQKGYKLVRNGLCNENASTARTIAALRCAALMQEITMCRKQYAGEPVKMISEAWHEKQCRHPFGGTYSLADLL